MRMLRTAALAATCVAGSTSLVLAQGAPAPPVPQSNTGTPYVGVAGALSDLFDVHVHPEDHPQSPGRAEERFNLGYAAAGVLGYAFGNGFALELEGAYVNNNVHKLSPTAPPNSQTGHAEAYGGFANAVYTFDLPKMGMDVGFVKPFVGIGVGPNWTHVNFPTNIGHGAAFNHIGGTSGINFAFQGFVGAAFPIPAVPGLATFVEYSLVGIDNPTPLRSNFYTPQGLSKGPILLSPIFDNLFTVGLVYAFGAPPPAPAMPVPVSSPPVQPTRTYLVFFDWDRADLTARASQIVAEAAAASTHVQTTRIEVNGYTDLSGTVAYNQGLSVRRAKAVEAALIHDGVPAAEIQIHGYGESNPLVPTAKGVREPQNRRVEIILR